MENVKLDALNMEEDSSEEESDYLEESDSEEEKNNDKNAEVYHQGGRGKKNAKATKKNQEQLRESILKQKAKRIFKEMQQEDAQSTIHIPTVKADDLLLQFHKRHPKENKKKNATKDELLNFLNIATSRVEENEAAKFDVKEIKEKCRVDVDDISEITENAIDEIENSGVVKVAKVIRFAGKTLTVEEKMDRSSRKYQAHMKNQNKKVGGKLEIIDRIVSSLDQPTSINSMQKSEADWIKYREAAGIEAELQKNRKDGFLEKQAFLANAEYREYANQLEKKRKFFNANSNDIPRP